MRIHDDLDARVCADASPVLGGAADRLVLEAFGSVAGHGTEVVRLADGEALGTAGRGQLLECMLLAGSLADGRSVHGPGAYLRCPDGDPAAWVAQGEAVVFCKRSAAGAPGERRLVVQTDRMQWHQGLVDGLRVMPLHQGTTGSTALVRWAPHTLFHTHRHPGGEEILVLEGVFRDEHGAYPRGTWIRSPHMSRHTPFTSAEGATILVKVGHLRADAG